MKLSKREAAHPLKVVRLLLDKSRAKFGELFGISDSYVERIEYRTLPLTNELADEIGLRYGLDAESLKGPRGFPRSLIDGEKFQFSFGDPDLVEPASTASDAEIRKAMVKAIDSNLAVNEEFERLLKVRDKYERLQLSMLFWQKYVLHGKCIPEPIENVLSNKLGLLFEAAKEKEKFYPVAMRLSRWIDDAVGDFRLRNRINELCARRTGDAAQWPAFIDTLGATVWRSQSSPRRRRRKR